MGLLHCQSVNPRTLTLKRASGGLRMALNDILFSYQPSGASLRTAKQDKLSAGGTAASQQMAKADLPRLEKYTSFFNEVGQKLALPPALLAAIASRETRGGNGLKNGWGDNGNGYGLMQVDKRSHKVVGGPFSRDHIEQAAGILKACFHEVQRRHPGWPIEQQLRGGLAAYNSGPGNVKTIENMDKGTTGDDYSNDTWARARFLVPHFGGVGKESEGAVVVNTQPQGSTPGVSTGTSGSKANAGTPVVRELQALLVKYGYMTDLQVQSGPGILGPKTRTALSRFLADKGPISSGISENTSPKKNPTQNGSVGLSNDPRQVNPTTQVVSFDPRKKLSAVHPKLAVYANQMAEALAKRGISILLTDGLRTFEEQDKLYAKGRTTSGKIVTYARGGYSNHNYGLAFDVVPLRNGKPDWDASRETWNIIGDEGKRVGLEWGGTWKKLVDLPHFQLPVGLEVEQCLTLFRKGGVSAVWAEADRRLRS